MVLAKVHDFTECLDGLPDHLRLHRCAQCAQRVVGPRIWRLRVALFGRFDGLPVGTFEKPRVGRLAGGKRYPGGGTLVAALMKENCRRVTHGDPHKAFS